MKTTLKRLGRRSPGWWGREPIFEAELFDGRRINLTPWALAIACLVFMVLAAAAQAGPLEDAARQTEAALEALAQEVDALDARVEALEQGNPPEPPEPPAQQLGLHVTQGELDAWRARVQTGPYVNRGDQSPNSIDGWARVVRHKARFMDRARLHFQKPEGARAADGCFMKYVGNGWQLKWTSIDARDAAFYALILEDRDVMIAVRDWLLAQMGRLDFADRRAWCLGRFNREHLFDLGLQIARMVFAVDYLTILDPRVLTPDQRASFEAWIGALAEVQYEASVRNNGQTWPGRPDDYTPPSPGYLSAGGKVPFYGGAPMPQSMRAYNNRPHSTHLFLAVAGAFLDRQDYLDEAKTYATEALMFGYHPAGYWGDFDRWRDQDPDLGLWYSWSQGALIAIADLLARRGDRGLYQYETSHGLNGTAGGPKSLATMAHDYLRYESGAFERYGTDDRARAGRLDYRIDNRAPRGGTMRQGFHFGNFLVANLYYRDAALAALYSRADPAMPAFVCCYYDIQDVAQIWPAPWFMWGLMDGEVDPYVRLP